MKVINISSVFVSTLLISFLAGCSVPTDKADTLNHKHPQSSEPIASAEEAEGIITANRNFDQDEIDAFVDIYPQFKQAQMMNLWLEEYEPGTFSFSGLVDPTDQTVVSPQATVDYGYNWFSVSDEPAILETPQYDKFFSVAIYDMYHNVPAVIVNPTKPIVILRPGQTAPDTDAHIVKLETDQGLAFTRMLIVDNLDEVRTLSEEIDMRGGNGDMSYPLAPVSKELEKATEDFLFTQYQRLEASGELASQDFPKASGDTSPVFLAIGVMIGQLGTPQDSVRYGMLTTDENGEPLNGKSTYIVTVPAGIVKEGGYYSVTLYDIDTKFLIPNDKKIYDRTTYSSQPNDDGTYTLTLSPSGEGKNGIPTGGKNFYGSLRAYVPEPNAVMKMKVEKQ